MPHPAKPPLPDPLPTSPLALLSAWFEEARAGLRNAMAAALATVEPDGRPSARMVICRGVDAVRGEFAFFTDARSEKARALTGEPRAALLFHWDAFERQVRVEGHVAATSPDALAAHWAGRHHDARVAVTASVQSRALAERRELVGRFRAATEAARNREVARPQSWVGYALRAERVELWVGRPDRVHDRARWQRRADGAWQGTRLEP